ncbi:unnamed protein product, partial [Allacma fusca]
GTPVPLLQYDYAGSTISISAQLEEKSIKEKSFHLSRKERLHCFDFLR